MYIWIDNGKLLKLSTKRLYIFYLFGKHEWFSMDTEINMDTENDFENNNGLRIFINILDDFLDLISSK